MLKLLYQQDDFPVFQNRMYENKEEAINCPKGNIRLVENLESGLVYNDAFLPELMVYDGNYQNEQAVSLLFQRHLETVATAICRSMGAVNLVEVGCGKGYFLEMLLTKGFDVTGFDPTYEGVNSRVKRQYFEPGVIDKAHGLILRHVLEHIQHPVSFLEQLKSANGGSGKIYIEVPCFDWICEHSAWFDIFYEHVNYFRLVDFHRMFGKIYESGHVFGGQYLYVVADLATLQKPVFNQADTFLFPANFSSGIERLAALTRGKRNVVWGGASKGVIFTLYMQRAGVNIDLIIDINPAKQNKFIAASGLKICSPEDGLKKLQQGDDIFVMNSNYLKEIMELTNNQFNYIKVD